MYVPDRLPFKLSVTLLSIYLIVAPQAAMNLSACGFPMDENDKPLGGPHSLDRNRAFLSYSRAGLPDRQLRLILLPSSFRDYGKTPGETEVGSAGEQPAKG